MSDPREAVEKAIESRLKVEQFDTKEAFERAQREERIKQEIAARKAAEQRAKTDVFVPPPPASIPFDDFKAESKVVIRSQETIKIKLPERKTGIRGIAFKPDTNIVDITQTLFEQSNFPTQTEMRTALEERGLGAKDEFKPNSVGEALTRFAYATSEAILGGVSEASFGLIETGRRGRGPRATVLQFAGAVATPTALDYAVGWVLSNLGKTIKGRVIIDKIVSRTPLELDEVRQWEKFAGPDGISTSDLRKLPDEKLKDIVEAIAEFYEKNPANKIIDARTTLVVPEEVFYDEFVDYVGFDADEYINFLKTYGDDIPNVDTSIYLTLGKINPSDQKQILDDVADYNLNNLVLGDTTTSITPEIIEELSDISKTGDPQEPGFTPPIEEILPDEDIEPIEAPPIQIQEPVLGEPAPQEPIIEPTPEDPIPPPIPFKQKSKARQKINLRLFRGPKIKYRVVHSYRDSTKTSITVPAQSIPEAISKAEGTRKINKRLKEVNITEAS